MSAQDKFLLDPYLQWTANEGIPIIEDFGVDLTTCDTGQWPRLGDKCSGSFVHLYGRGDWMTIFIYQIPPGGSSAPQQHMFDEIFYVLEGHGSMTVELADGSKRTFEFGPRSLFAPPLNCKYRIFNGSGQTPLRLASGNDLRILMNILNNEAFFFDNPYPFPERNTPENFYAGEGEMTSIRPGRHLWETNFIPDLSAIELKPWEARGAGSSNVQFLLCESSIGAHLSEMPVGTYKKGHRHGPGLHVMFVHGSGYSLLWYYGEKDYKRVEWKHGVVFAPPDEMFHQHFDTSQRPARYLALGFGSKRYPCVLERRIGSEGRRTDVSIKEGGAQVEYADQDPRIHGIWLEEIRKTGVQSQMGKYIDESIYSRPAAE